MKSLLKIAAVTMAASSLFLSNCKKEHPAPQTIISFFSPMSDPEGTIVTITGQNFSTAARENALDEVANVKLSGHNNEIAMCTNPL